MLSALIWGLDGCDSGTVWWSHDNFIDCSSAVSSHATVNPRREVATDCAEALLTSYLTDAQRAELAAHGPSPCRAPQVETTGSAATACAESNSARQSSACAVTRTTRIRPRPGERSGSRNSRGPSSSRRWPWGVVQGLAIWALIGAAIAVVIVAIRLVLAAG